MWGRKEGYGWKRGGHGILLGRMGSGSMEGYATGTWKIDGNKGR
jgi:hypothetical protein